MNDLKSRAARVPAIVCGRPMRTLGMASGKHNNFDAIRALAALAVLVSHSFPLSYGSGARQPLATLSNGQTELGSIAVLVFFVISGYLVTQSFERAPDALRFLQARALRIFPGLLAALLFTVLVLGPALTALPVSCYFADPGTAAYVPLNMTLVFMQYPLPGVFTGNLGGQAANAVLWTLEYEAFMYGVVLLLGLARLLNRASVPVLWLAAVLLHHWPINGDADYLWPLSGDHVRLAIPFLSGAALYLWRDLAPLNRSLAIASAAALAASLMLGGFHLAFAVFGAYLVLYLALSPDVRLPNLARQGDLSYGLYIYAWPVQQAIAHLLGNAITWYWSIAFSLPVVLGLAWLSWRCVEKPALAFKRPAAPRPAATLRESSRTGPEGAGAP